jgi:hypothetical protein
VLFLVLKRQGRVKKCAPPEVVIKNVTKHSASLASTRPKFNTCATKKKKKKNITKQSQLVKTNEQMCCDLKEPCE